MITNTNNSCLFYQYDKLVRPPINGQNILTIEKDFIEKKNITDLHNSDAQSNTSKPERNALEEVDETRHAALGVDIRGGRGASGWGINHHLCAA